MFKRGTVVQHKVNPWIGVVLTDAEVSLPSHYVAIKWFEGRNGGGHVLGGDIAPISGYEFEAALALGDTDTVLRLYRAAQSEPSKQEQQAEAKARRLQAGINVIGQHLANSTDEVVRELTGEKPYFMPGIITAVQFLVDAHTKLQVAITPFARFGQLQHRYAPDALFTIAYDRTGKEVAIRYADFAYAAELVPNVETAGQGEAQIGGRGGIAEIMVGDKAADLVRAGLMDAPKFTYRVRWTSRADGLTRTGQASANSEAEALERFYGAAANALSAEVIETTPYGVPFASGEVTL